MLRLVTLRDLLRSLFIEPERALSFNPTLFLILYYVVLAAYSVTHATIVHAVIGWTGFTLGMVRVLLSCSISLLISVPAIFGYYVIIPKTGFWDALRRFLFYFTSVLLITLLGETFMAKIIAGTDLKAQPIVTFAAGVLSLVLLRRGTRRLFEPFLILCILLIAQIQAYWIVADLFPYPEAERIASPFVEVTRISGWGLWYAAVIIGVIIAIVVVVSVREAQPSVEAKTVEPSLKT